LKENSLGATSEVIHPGKGSRYILRPIGATAHADFSGGYFEIRLRVENTGTRNSVISGFAIEIRELGLEFPNLLPEVGQRRVQGRHCIHGLDPQSGLTDTKILQIAPESSTKEGTLAFFIDGLNLGTFTTAGLVMHGDERRFDSLHCRLTVADSSGVKASTEFELTEA